MQLPIGGRKRFKGTITAIESDTQTVRVMVDGTAYDLPFIDMQNAKLVMTDALVDESLRRRGLDAE